jgi:hypothetical protein
MRLLIFGGGICKTYKFCKETGIAVFPQNLICKSILQKVALMQGLLQDKGRCGIEDRLCAGLDPGSETGPSTEVVEESRMPEDLP